MISGKVQQKKEGAIPEAKGAKACLERGRQGTKQGVQGPSRRRRKPVRRVVEEVPALESVLVRLDEKARVDRSPVVAVAVGHQR